jgi:lipopolysaccharide transport system permease protein
MSVSSAPTFSGPTLVIEPSRRFPRVGLRELWAYRGLFWFLVWRDVKVRYAQTVLGVAWAVFQPVLTMVVFAVVFGRLARMPSDGAPYPVFALAALVPWTYFATGVTAASNSLTASTGLITKVYFPRLVIPFAAIAAGLPDLAIGLAFLGVVMAAYGVAPALAAVVVLPVLVASMLVTMAGVGCWLAALNIQFRDVKFVVPVLTQVWLYASPVIYPASMVPPRFRGLYALNPMAGVIEGFRAALLGSRPVPWGDVAVSTAVGAALFVSGTLYFRRTERVFADVA